MTDDPIRIGTMLYTLVEPHRGHQVEYNRWYERDHFYAGCQIGAYNFAGARFVATAPLKSAPVPDGRARPADLSRWWPTPQVGSYLGLYFVLDGHHDEWNRWAVDQVNVLHASGRMYEKRDHVHTGLYRFEWEHRRDEDGVPAELTLDHRFAGHGLGLRGADRRRVPASRPARPPGTATQYLPSVLPGSGRGHGAGVQPAAPPGRRARATCPGTRSSTSGSCSCSSWMTTRPASWPAVFAGQDEAVAARPAWAGSCGPRRSSGPSPGTDTYTDQLWSGPDL